MSNEQSYIFDLPAQKKELELLYKDLQQASSIIKDGISRYKKNKLRVKSKKQAEDFKSMFAELEPYASLQEIQDAYGWAIISENEYNRLVSLWKLRDKYANKKNEFEDRVTKILDYAICHLSDPYVEDIFDIETALSKDENERKSICDKLRRERQKFEYDQYIKSIKANSEVGE